MPVILRNDGFRLLFYSNEGDPREPMHVHVLKSGCEAKLWLFPVVTLAESHGFKSGELRDIIRLVESNRLMIERAWHDHFGN